MSNLKVNVAQKTSPKVLLVLFDVLSVKSKEFSSFDREKQARVLSEEFNVECTGRDLYMLLDEPSINEEQEDLFLLLKDVGYENPQLYRDREDTEGTF